MRPPDWLLVPSAEPVPGGGSKGFGSQCHPSGLAVDGDGRRLLFVSDPAVAFDLRRAAGVALGGVWFDGFDDLCHDPVWRHLGDPIEVLDPGSLKFAQPALGHGMDRHSLDVALSIGRHAAERAKLAGCVRLTGIGHGLDSELRSVSDTHFHGLGGVGPACTRAYAALRHLGRFEIAGLVGAAIAGAQMGLLVRLRGAAGAIASQLARGVNAGVGDWLDDVETVGQVQTGDGISLTNPNWDAPVRSPVVDSRAHLVG